MKLTWITLSLVWLCAAPAFAESHCDGVAKGEALEAFRTSTHAEGSVTFLRSESSFLSDIAIYDIYVTVAAHTGGRLVEISYEARIEANDTCSSVSFGEVRRRD